MQNSAFMKIVSSWTKIFCFKLNKWMDVKHDRNSWVWTFEEEIMCTVLFCSVLYCLCFIFILKMHKYVYNSFFNPVAFHFKRKFSMKSNIYVYICICIYIVFLSVCLIYPCSTLLDLWHKNSFDLCICGFLLDWSGLFSPLSR